MHPSPEQFAILLQCYIEDRYSPAELELLMELIDEPDYHLLAADLIEGTIEKTWQLEDDEDQALEARLDQRLIPIMKEHKVTAPVHRVHFLKRFRWAAAAILLLIAGAGGWFLLNKEQTNPAIAFTGKVAPGKEGAKLRLSSGQVIMIDTVRDGLIAMEGKVAVYKQNGQIYYKGNPKDAVVYNEIITDRGRQWSAQLPDGSTVWLNAASSLRYPLTFNGRERVVAMTGEASFSVVHNASQPFKVTVRDHTIRDIGTEFNINAYQNEPRIVTTVVEGSASVSVGSDRVVVEAGKAAQMKDGKLEVAKANTEQAIAWRKGYFDFEGSDLKTVCRQLERWYNIDVVFEAGVPDVAFGGSTKRSQDLSDVLEVLRLSGVKFRLEEGGNGKEAKLVLLP